MVLDDAWNESTRVFGHRGVRAVHVLAITLGILNFILNGLIWYAFSVSSKKLLNKAHLHLFYVFAITNCLTGFFTIPTYVNLFLHNNLNCPRWTIIIGSGFEMGLDRVRSVISIAIAVERLHAICRPRTFYFKDHARAAKHISLFATGWGIADMIFMIAEDDLFTIRIHCVSTSSSGVLFHSYFLISSVLFGVVLTVVYVMFLIRFILFRKNIGECSKKREQFSQANSLTLTVILSVLIFSVFPCVLYIHDLVVHKVFFMDYGPVVTIGYHMYGIICSFCYNYKHRDIRIALDKAYPIRRAMCGSSGASFTSSNAPRPPRQTVTVCREDERFTTTVTSHPEDVML